MTDLSEHNITYRGSVHSWHCDHMGHMNVMWYVGKFDEATWNLFAQVGITPSYVRDGHWGMAALEQNIKYKRELLEGDVLFVASSIIEMAEKVIRFRHRMFNGETRELCSTMEVVGIHIDTQARKSCPFPENIRAAGVALVGEGSDDV